jgi:hypothetical protein
VQLIQDGTSMWAVARRFAVSVSVVSRAWRCYQETGQYIRRCGGGCRGQQPCSRTVTSAFVQGGALPEPCKMTSSRPQMCMCLLKRSETDSMRVVWGPDVHRWGLCLQPNAMQDFWHLPENTKIGKFATGALCSSQMKAGSHWAHVTVPLFFWAVYNICVCIHVYVCVCVYIIYVSLCVWYILKKKNTSMPKILTFSFHLTPNLICSYKLHMLVLMGPLQGNDICWVAKMIKLYSKTLKATLSYLSPHFMYKEMLQCH